MKSKSVRQWGRLTAVVAVALLAVACGGGGGGGDTPTPTDPSGTTPSTGTTPPTGTPTSGTPNLLDPTIISRAGEGGNEAPLLAIDAAGNALSIWFRKVDTSSFPYTYELLARRYVPASGWQPIQVLTTSNTRTLEFPTLTVDKTTGKAIAMWTEKRSTANANNQLTSDIIARSFDPAAGWAAPVIVESDQPILNSRSVMATDANGNVMAVWNRYESLRTTIYASRYTAGGGWSAPTRIEDDTTLAGGGSGQLVTFLPNGDALVVWNTSRGGSISNIWSNKYTVGSGWGTNKAVISGVLGQGNTLTRLLGGARSLVADPSGNAILTFENQQLFLNPTRYEMNLWSLRYSGGAWAADTTAVPVGVPLTCTNCPSVYGGTVKMNAQGAAVATWELRDAAGKDIVWASRTRGDGSWEAQALNPNATGFVSNRGFSDMGIDDQGNITVVWPYTDTVTNTTDINTARYTAGTGWSAPQLLESYTGTADLPRIAMNALGKAMTVWLQFENTVGSVIASRYYN